VPKIRFKTDCQADVRETWEIETPDGEQLADLRDYVADQLHGGNASHVNDQTDNEHNREIDWSTLEIVD